MEQGCDGSDYILSGRTTTGGFKNQLAAGGRHNLVEKNGEEDCGDNDVRKLISLHAENESNWHFSGTAKHGPLL